MRFLLSKILRILPLQGEKNLPNLRFLSVRDEHKAIFPYFCSQNSMNHAKELSHRGVSRES
ncbi:MAG: hypothetical protein SPK22_04490, partial [Alloprevotella sp.]|nr:hypothetical protein [Bacteroidales bacterium]MDY5769456.1 hypothetical protein [Alloprevotella sp.]